MSSPVSAAPSSEKTFPAKVILFGEYTVLRGSQALATPLWSLVGAWRFGSAGAVDSRLVALNDYLKNLVEAGILSLDTEGFDDDIRRGLVFDSSIPTGYGAGSSGALVAAIYAAYATEKEADLEKLKAILGKMESHFHGTSSGFDPLVSYIQRAILIQKDGKMRVLDAPSSDLSIFLIDTQQPRKTEPLVKLFFEKCAAPQYNELIVNELVPHVDDAIASYLEQRSATLFDTLHHISLFQYRFLPEMIPLAFKNIWLEGLSNSVFKLKLCGAGGGGFILGFAPSFDDARAALAQFGFNPIKIG